MDPREYHFKATLPKLNIDRFFNIYTTVNLFGEYEAITVYGRVGTQGRCKIYRFNSVSDLNQTVTQIIKKRLTSKKRIGVDYQLV